jgi:cytoskeleton protein RodZ
VTRQAFGQHLRKHRDRRRLTLAQVAENTKVSASLLRSVEEGGCARWPGGIYSRGFVRAYASAVGLDPEHAVAMFTECYPEFAPAPAPDPAAETEQPPQSAAEILRSVLGLFSKGRRGASV